MKNLKKISGGDTPGLPQREGATPPAPTPSMATRCARGRKLPRCWDLGLGNRSPKSKFTTTSLPIHVALSTQCIHYSYYHYYYYYYYTRLTASFPGQPR